MAMIKWMSARAQEWVDEGIAKRLSEPALTMRTRRTWSSPRPAHELSGDHVGAGAGGAGWISALARGA